MSINRAAGRLFAERMIVVGLAYTSASCPDESTLPEGARQYLAQLVGLMWAAYDFALFDGGIPTDMSSRIITRINELARGLDAVTVRQTRDMVVVSRDFDAALSAVVHEPLREGARNAV